MLRRPIRFLVLLAVAGSALAAGAATETVEPAELRYTMHFGGFHVADLHFEQERSAERYAAGIRIRTAGLADMVLRYKGTAAVDGVLLDDGLLRPERYGFRYKSRKSRRVVEVDYDPADSRATRVRSEKRGKPDRVEVPEELWQEVLDPLSAVLMLREEVRERAGEPGSFRTGVFDGRRRYELAATIARPTVSGRDGMATVEVAATIRPIAGFDPDDMTEREQREGYRIQAQFTEGPQALPLEIRTLNTRAIVVIRLAGCSGGTACATADAERGRRSG